ncbi:MAG: DnaJ domain-containing protein [Nitrospina sp.]|nr:DnaJ domain-containing protein [Nitrospina sp.]
MVTTTKTHYEVLEIEPQAGYLEIRKAYRRLAKQYHPDKIQNPTEEDQRRFAEIAEAHRVLTNLKLRQAYDLSLNQARSHQQAPPPPPWAYWRPHYSGYPYFRWDFITPYMHGFFVGEQHEQQSPQEKMQALLFNYKTLVIAILGALYFFKFFSVMSGDVVEKKTEERLFNNVSYFLTLKTEEEKTVRKRVKYELYDRVAVDDHIEKPLFSFTWRVNNDEIPGPGVPRFFLQVAMIYGVITCGLYLLERGYRKPTAPSGATGPPPA